MVLCISVLRPLRVISCPGRLTGTSWKYHQGVGLSVFARYERSGSTGTRLENDATPVKALVLHTVDADVKGLALFIGQEPAIFLKNEETEEGDVKEIQTCSLSWLQ